MKNNERAKTLTILMLLCFSLASVNLLGQVRYDSKVRLNNGDYYGVEQKGKWGVCDMNFRVIIVPKYENIGMTLVGDYFKVSQHGKWGICNKSGREIITPRYDYLSNDLIGDNFGVRLNDKWGVCDMNGNEIIEPKYDGIALNMVGDYFGVIQNDKWGVCDMNGHEIIVPKYDGLSKNLIGGYFGVKQNDKWGLCDMNGYEIIAPKYDEISKLKGDYFQVKLNGKYGACDMNGKEVIVPRDCDDLYLLGNNFVIEKNHAKGLMDFNGEMIIPCGVKDIDSWNNNLSFVQVTTFDNHIGVYSEEGELVVPVIYSNIRSYNSEDGFKVNGFVVQNEEGYYGYYTTDGHLLVSPSMGIEDLSVLDNHNYLIAFIGNREGLIDESGNFVVPVGMYYGFDEKEDGSAIIGRKDGKCCELYPNGSEKFVSKFVNFQEDDNHQIVAKQGKEELFRNGSDIYYRVYDDRGAVGVACNDRRIIDCEYEKIDFDHVGNRVIFVYKDGYWGVCDCLGNIIIPVKYNNYGLHEEKFDIIGVRKGMKWGVCRVDGRVIIEPDEYNGVGTVLDSNGHFMVKKGNYYGMCDMNGNMVVKPEYTDITTFTVKSKGIYVVKQGDREGLLDASGRTIIPPIYDHVGVYETPEFYEVTLNGRKGVYDREGNVIFAPEYDKLTYFLDEGFQYEDESGKWVPLNISIDDNGNAYYSYNSSYNEYFDEGGNYFEEKKYKKAVKSYKKALEHKQTPDAYFNIGVCYYNMEKYDDAIEYFQQCLNCSPRSSLEERAQNLIEKSRLYIEIDEKAKEIAAETVDRMFKKNRSDALSILSAILTGNNVNSTPNARGNMDHLLDPNYAIWQTQQQEYESYLRMTSGGTSMTFEEWKAINAQAASSSSVQNGGGNTSNPNSSSGNPVQPHQVTKDCPLCHGSGKCNTCNGTHRIDYQFGAGTLECPNCKPDGRCTHCGGTGKDTSTKYY